MIRSVEEREKYKDKSRRRKKIEGKLRFYFNRRQRKRFSWLLHGEQKLWIYMSGK